MAIIFSLQGCMAVGKTTAVKYVEKNFSKIYVSYENPLPLLSEVRNRNLQQNTLEGFIEIQRIFINDIVKEYEQIKNKEYVLIDLGAEEIEFFTLFYPKSIGFDWNMEKYLESELFELRKCMADHVLFLDAKIDTLMKHKENDLVRKRGLFEHYLQNMLPIKRKWFFEERNKKPEILLVDGMNIDEVGESVLSWIKSYIV
jgi:hypothetical protein